jgi:hypothetical protein
MSLVKRLGDKRLSDEKTRENCRTGGEKGQVENDTLLREKLKQKEESICLLPSIQKIFS